MNRLTKQQTEQLRAILRKLEGNDTMDIDVQESAENDLASFIVANGYQR